MLLKRHGQEDIAVEMTFNSMPEEFALLQCICIASAYIFHSMQSCKLQLSLCPPARNEQACMFPSKAKRQCYACASQKMLNEQSFLHRAQQKAKDLLHRTLRAVPCFV